MSTWTNILDLVYPVGSMYFSTSSTSPATLFGGTWTQVTSRFIIAAAASHTHPYLPLSGGDLTGAITTSETITATGGFVGVLTGNASSATQLSSSAGSKTKPVYFSSGKPAACSYTLGKSVPSNAVFTDTNTHYASKNVIGASTAITDTASTLTNGNVYLNSVENDAVTSVHKIPGSGATAVTSDANGNIVITSTNTDTTYSAGTGISLSDTTFSNSGVRSVATGSSNGTISVNTNGTSADVVVKGLGCAAYTASRACATASHGHNYISAGLPDLQIQILKSGLKLLKYSKSVV